MHCCILWNVLAAPLTSKEQLLQTTMAVNATTASTFDDMYQAEVEDRTPAKRRP